MDNGDLDADDWRGYTDLANDLVAQKRAQEAVAAARRAVALAPDEPDAHLALADALLAIYPRRTRARSTALAEIDKAELLGADAQELADRRNAPRSGGFEAVRWTAMAVFFAFGLEGHGNAANISKAIAWPAMFVFIFGTAVVSARFGGQTFREKLKVKKTLHRRRLATTEQVMQRAPAFAACLSVLVLPGAALAVPGADNDAQSKVLSRLLLTGIILVVPAAWIGVDLWLRPGTVVRALFHDMFAAISVPITLFLAVISPVLVLRRLHSSGLWFAVYLGGMIWTIGIIIAGFMLTSRRKKAARW